MVTLGQYAELSIDGRLTGRAISRKNARVEGGSYAIAFLAVTSGDHVLLQERSPNKKSQPGRLDLSAAGHVEVGDAQGTNDIDLVFRRAAVREAKEELGIRLNPNSLGFLTSFHEDKTAANGTPYRKHIRVYTCQVDRSNCHLEHNRDEVAGLGWVTMEEMTRLPEAKITRELSKCRKRLQVRCRRAGA